MMILEKNRIEKDSSSSNVKTMSIKQRSDTDSWDFLTLLSGLRMVTPILFILRRVLGECQLGDRWGPNHQCQHDHILHSAVRFPEVKRNILGFLQENRMFIKPNFTQSSLEEIVRVAVIPFMNQVINRTVQTIMMGISEWMEISSRATESQQIPMAPRTNDSTNLWPWYCE